MLTAYLWDGVEGSSGHKELVLSPAQHGTHTGKQSIQHLWVVGRQNPLPQLSRLAWDQLGMEHLKFVYLGASGKEEQHLTLMQGENHCVAVKRKTEVALGKRVNICHSFRKQQDRTCRLAKCLSKVPGGEGINVLSGTRSNFPSHCGKLTVALTCSVIVINI